MLAGDLSPMGASPWVQDSNCRDPRGIGKCQYGGVCRLLIVIYNITCKMTNKIYIGNTKRNFKKQMAGHFQDVKQLINTLTGCTVDLFYRYVVNYCV
jgi:hypothetical protein